MPWVGEIRMFAGNIAPTGWMRCDGQILAISEHEALFNLLGTTYGGDGITIFQLPDLRGRVPVHAGQGPGLGQRVFSEVGGSETAGLTTQQVPAHSHPLVASDAAATSPTPTGRVLAEPVKRIYADPGGTTPLAPSGPFGGSQAHENMAPSLGITFIISLSGAFPFE